MPRPDLPEPDSYTDLCPDCKGPEFEILFGLTSTFSMHRACLGCGALSGDMHFTALPEEKGKGKWAIE